MRQGVTRIRILISGAVQGVGFRPFVYRLATEHRLAGWVSNSPDGVIIEAEADKNILDDFLIRIQSEHPPHASIHSLEFSLLDSVGYPDFEIRQSQVSGTPSTLVLPDIATCTDCLSDLFDPANRRYLYPFTNCTNCGPRFTIIQRIPYDRANTTMRDFEMCGPCRLEYEDPTNRRFHAQPNSCWQCGPQAEMWDPTGKTIALRDEAIEHAVQAVRDGLIVAVKGLGGFHLMVDSTNEDAIRRLRLRKPARRSPLP